MKYRGASLIILLLILTASPLLAACQAVDVAAYFVPSYNGWQTASEVWTGPAGPAVSDQWYSYAPNKYAHIKFDNPLSVETFTVGSTAIYLTAENGQNNTDVSRTFTPGPSQPGLTWMPRLVYTCPGCSVQQTIACSNQNTFIPCHDGENDYTNCQFTNSYPAHCFRWNSAVSLFSYDYGYSIGTVQTVMLGQTEDDLSSERYYYGLGLGFLRFEAYDSSGNLTSWGAATQINLNQPIGDHACFHP
jgi:hypothetical protein